MLQAAAGKDDGARHHYRHEAPDVFYDVRLMAMVLFGRPGIWVRGTRYAEGEHEVRGFRGRNTPAYGIVVPITHRLMVDVRHHR